MQTYTIILYNQYGKWSATTPFQTLREAERHANLYFRIPSKDYCKGICFLEIELPSFPTEKELGNYSAERID